MGWKDFILFEVFSEKIQGSGSYDSYAYVLCCWSFMLLSGEQKEFSGRGEAGCLKARWVRAFLDSIVQNVSTTSSSVWWYVILTWASPVWSNYWNRNIIWLQVFCFWWCWLLSFPWQWAPEARNWLRPAPKRRMSAGKKSFFLLFSFQPAVTIILSVTSIKRLIVREERLVLRLLVAELLQLPQEGWVRKDGVKRIFLKMFYCKMSNWTCFVRWKVLGRGSGRQGRGDNESGQEVHLLSQTAAKVKSLSFLFPYHCSYFGNWQRYLKVLLLQIFPASQSVSFSLLLH